MRRILNRKLLALVMFGLPATALFFQNCSNGFKSKSFAELNSSGAPTAVYENPAVTVDQAFSSLSNLRDRTLNFTVKIDARLRLKEITCSLDGAPAVDCQNRAFAMPGLMDGDHSVVIRAQDSLGQNADEIRVVFRVDATKPTISFSQQPASLSGVSSVFDFMATDNLSGVSTLSCTLDGKDYIPCARPLALTGLADGSHTFSLQVKDAAGNVSDPLPYTWMVNKNEASLRFASTPAATTKLKTATFSFSGMLGTAPVTYFECSVDGAAFAQCTSPRGLTALTDGAHTFALKGKDASGVLSQPLIYTWKVDTVLPTTPVLNSSFTGTATKLTSVSVSFSSSDAASGIASYQCSIDMGVFAACASPKTLSTLADGDHSLRVKAMDLAGNESAIAMAAWKVDTVVPKVEITVKPPLMATTQDATFAFAATDSGAGIATLECQLDTSAYAACTSPKSFSGLAQGSHIFRIRATDRAANKTDADYTWTVQAAPLDGKVLYTNNCAGCHGALENSVLRDKTAPEISLAILSVPQMAGLSALAQKPEEIEAIATYLGTPQLCAPGPRPWTTARLNSTQVYFTLLDLLGVKINRALLPLDGTRNTFQNNLGLQLDPGVLQLYLDFAEKEMPNLLPAFKSKFVSTCSAANTACLKTGFSQLAKTAFHGTLSTAKADAIFAVYTASTSAGATYDQALEDVLISILVSAEFLFPFESARLAGQKPTGLETANRLALLVWLSVPDATLLTKAGDGSLGTDAGIKAELDRMLKDVKGERFRKNFVGGWAGLRSFLGTEPAIGSMAANYQTETLMYFDDLMRSSAAPVDVVTSGFTYVNSALATQYGLSGTFSTAFTKTSLTQSQRIGLLSQGSFLTNVASPTFSTVYKRGNHILHFMMCNPTPPPPPGVVPVEGNIDLTGKTDAEIAQIHRSKSTTCYACHARMDPLGLSLAMFDQFGSLKVNYAPVKPELATMPDGTVLGDPKLLAAYLSRGNRLQSCFVTGLASYVYSGYEADNVRCAKEVYATKANSGPVSISSWISTLISESLLDPK